MNANRRIKPRELARMRGDDVPQRPTSTPLVTVVIPSFNYARFLELAADSALGQEGVDVEVVIVDDASTDGSQQLARAFVDRDARVRLIVHEQNLGPVATFNDGLDAARGEYLIRLDADDLLTPGAAARASALAERFPNVGMVYGHPVHFSDEDPPGRYRNRATWWDVMSGSSWLELRCRLGVNCITSPEVLMRTSLLRRIGGQRALAHTHDMELWFRLARHADVGWLGGCDQAWHREHPDSLSARQVTVMTDFEERAQAFRTLFTDGLGDPVADRLMLRTALNALANEAAARASSAYAKGRGASPETEGYLRFARSLGVDLSTLPQARALRAAQRLGRKRAPFSPYLFAHAARYRITRELGKPRWRSRGL
jgi:hypothetical protein